MTGHHRALVLHTYKNSTHLHVVWDRINEHTLKAVNLYRDHTRSNAVARELERELGLRRLREQRRDPERELAAPTLAEEQQARRKGQDLQERREAIRTAWQQSQDGKSFAEALDERGFTLAQGDRRDYVALDERGSVYSIGKRTTGATAREVRAKLADLERERLPTVEQARADLPQRQQARAQARQARQEAEREAWIERARAELEQEQERARKKAQDRPEEAQRATERAQEPATLAEEAQKPENAPEHGVGAAAPTHARDPWDTAAAQTTAPEPTAEPDPQPAPHHDRAEHGVSASHPNERSGLRVVDRDTGLESSVSAFAGKALDYMATQAEGLIEGMASLFDGGSSATPQRRSAPEPPRAPKSALQRLQERAAKERALRNLSKNLKRGEDLNAADLRNLPKTQLERLRDGGDEYLQRMVKNWEREERERDDGRERER